MSMATQVVAHEHDVRNAGLGWDAEPDGYARPWRIPAEIPLSVVFCVL